MKTLPTPEKDVLKACVELLELKRCCYLRVHPVRLITRNGQTFPGTIPAGQRGAPDLLILHKGQAICCEVKSSRGVLSVAQESWKERALCAGAIYITVHSVEDLQMVIP